MNDRAFEIAIRAWSQDEAAERASAGLRDRVLRIPSTVPRSRLWQRPIPTGTSRPLFGAAKSMVAAVIVALFGGFVLVAQPADRPGLGPLGAVSDEPGLPPRTGPAGNGLVAYAHAGDIFVGDPRTGETTAIVSGPEIDSAPIFSPDGTRIAFLRGGEWTADASILVVRADGSDERVVMPAGYSDRGTDFAWHPDSAYLLVNHDSPPFTTPYYDGELSLLDASGLAEPRLLTPPLPIGPGGPYIRNAQVAPMFRPPDGDVILSAANDPAAVDPDDQPGRLELLYAWDADLESHAQLALDVLDAYEPYSFSPWGLWWSPDGSRIAFVLGWGDGRFGTFVMNADGGAVRSLGDDFHSPGAWSPDGSSIAFERGCPDPDLQGAVIVAVDVHSGVERLLEATAVDTKTEGQAKPVPPEVVGQCVGGWYEEPGARAWDYEGWSWSPDGSSIVMLERYGARPLVVDVDTGKATELPWAADSAPSWQRVGPHGGARRSR
jgi:dipeptidyl aminopeptidase/acylaminoacyl peptidase